MQPDSLTQAEVFTTRMSVRTTPMMNAGSSKRLLLPRLLRFALDFKHLLEAFYSRLEELVWVQGRRTASRLSNEDFEVRRWSVWFDLDKA